MLTVGVFALAGIVALFVSHLRSLDIIPLLSEMATSAWQRRVEKEQLALKAGNEEEAREAAEREEQRLRIEALTQQRLDALKPKADANSLKLVSAETLRRMEEELGGNKIKGLSIISERGRMWREDQPFELGTMIMPFVFSQRLGMSPVFFKEESELIDLISGPRPVINKSSIPLIQTRLRDVMTVHIDTNAKNLSFINEQEAARLRTVHGISDALLMDLRKKAAVMVEADKREGTRFFDMAILPPEQEAAIRAMQIVKHGGDRIAAVRLLLPEKASEFFAEQIFSFIVMHMVFHMFHKADEGTRYEKVSDKFEWVYIWALHNMRYQGTGESEVTLLVGKRDNPPAIRKLLIKQREMMEQANEAYEQSLKKEQKEPGENLPVINEEGQ